MGNDDIVITGYCTLCSPIPDLDKQTAEASCLKTKTFSLCKYMYLLNVWSINSF